MAVNENGIVDSDYESLYSDEDGGATAAAAAAAAEEAAAAVAEQELVKRSLPLHERVLNDLCTDEELDGLLKPLKPMLQQLEGMQGFEWCLEHIDDIRRTDSSFPFKKTLFITLLGLLPEMQAYVRSYTPMLIDDTYATMFFPELRALVDMYNNTELRPQEVLDGARVLCARATAYQRICAQMRARPRTAKPCRGKKRKRCIENHTEEEEEPPPPPPRKRQKY
jgi:hypothetical protein